MKKALSILCLLLFLFPYSASAEQEYYTIHEIQEQAREMLKAAELTGTIQIETTKGMFDVSIEIPEVDRVPIVQVTLPSSNQVPSVPENGKVTEHMVDYHSTSYLTGWVVDVNRDELYGEYVKNTHRIGQYGMDAYADGSPLTMEESIAFAEQILHPYKELCGWEFSLQRAYANSRRYKATAGKNGFISRAIPSAFNAKMPVAAAHLLKFPLPGKKKVFGNRLQAEVNAAFAADDPMMTALVSDGEISAMADLLADRYAGYIKQAASNLLAGIDRDVDDFIGSRPLKTGQ